MPRDNSKNQSPVNASSDANIVPASTDTVLLVERVAKIATRRRAAPKPQEEIVPLPESPKPRNHLSPIENAQLALFDLENSGRFSAHPIRPSTEHPTFLTRVPIFLPARRSNQRQCLEDDNSMRFNTSWGAGKKHGPPLTVYDEDTLMAIGRLRSKRLAGRPHNMPLPVTDLFKVPGRDDVNVHIVQCLLTDLQHECGTERGGNNNKLRLESVKRLAATTIELDTKTADKIVSRGTTFKLLDVAWQEYVDNAVLYIQFTPIMASWYENEYTYIDWNLRRKLTDTGKAIHRFLASQPKTYEIRCELLMSTIQYLRDYKKFMLDLKTTLGDLKREGWIREWEITGTGRRTPHKLSIARL